MGIYMKFRKLLLASVVVTLFVTCDRTGDSYIVGDVFTDTRAVLGYVDSFSLQLSTIRLDSFVTSGYSDIFIGHFKDEVVGNVTTETYIPINIASHTTIEEEDIYDSIVICFKPKGNWLGDTVQPKEIKIYEVLEEIKPREIAEQQMMFNHQSLKYSDKELATVRIEPNPKVGLVSWARMSDSLGQKWFDMVKNADDAMFDNIYFEQFFYGICIVPQTTDYTWGLDFYSNNENALYSTEWLIEDAMEFEIRLHYRKSGDDEDDSFMTFIAKPNSFQFTHFVNDRSGTAFENLEIDGGRVYSQESNNMSYIQTGSGMALRIDFPTLASIQSASEYMSVVDARLVIRPHDYSYDDAYRLPTMLYLALTDESNDLFGNLSDITGNMVASPVYTDVSTGDPFYDFSVLPFVKNYLKNTIDNSMSIVVLPSNAENSTDFRRLVVDDNTKFGENIQLQIYYTTY